MKMWICRDMDNTLWLAFDEPQRDIDSWWFHEGRNLNDEDFPEVTFENSPQEVELKLIEK